MLSIAHGPTGALIASKIPNPFISLPLVVVSHFLEDKIPHWDVGQGLTKKTKSKQAAFYQELFLDFPLSIALVYFFFQHGQPFSPLPWLGWFFGLLPDFIEAPRNFLSWEPAFLRPLSRFHHDFHHSIPDKFRGLVPQILIIIAIYLLR